MKIKSFKKKAIMLSLIFILTGTIIFIAGFGFLGFNNNRLKEYAYNDTWYQTIHVNSNNELWFGIEFGDDIHLFTIGKCD
ncbi:hypothetical protein C8E03_107173 [Lachnotalea glycerini]|jgi:hypothetical protein|uniref:Uncharacterized protein n=1 Tax=Lachnotalea glycerini TaxID=1763509 RepID=A0A255IHH5_9FIRM|nr:hypothetical protein [Lachnotalea glycerini]OYO99957.1 hypothetical protein CG709_11685 [Lachnotalea glycerini]PXV89196.1 hypothetical protein C8E03_107173 [Lachnotalea glycerini]RDY31458.1 hypothetical protein CG710_009455 [Lachnotalea glycerini]